MEVSLTKDEERKLLRAHTKREVAVSKLSGDAARPQLQRLLAKLSEDAQHAESALESARQRAMSASERCAAAQTRMDHASATHATLQKLHTQLTSRHGHVIEQRKTVDASDREAQESLVQSLRERANAATRALDEASSKRDVQHERKVRLQQLAASRLEACEQAEAVHRAAIAKQLATGAALDGALSEAMEELRAAQAEADDADQRSTAAAGGRATLPALPALLALLALLALPAQHVLTPPLTHFYRTSPPPPYPCPAFAPNPPPSNPLPHPTPSPLPHPPTPTLTPPSLPPPPSPDEHQQLSSRLESTDGSFQQMVAELKSSNANFKKQASSHFSEKLSLRSYGQTRTSARMRERGLGIDASL